MFLVFIPKMFLVDITLEGYSSGKLIAALGLSELNPPSHPMHRKTSVWPFSACVDDCVRSLLSGVHTSTSFTLPDTPLLCIYLQLSLFLPFHSS
jgi:hypothetical protein